MNQITPIEPPNLCLYPKNSTDASLAAWVVKKAFGNREVNFREIDYAEITPHLMQPVSKPIIGIVSPNMRLYFDHLQWPRPKQPWDDQHPNWKYGSYFCSPHNNIRVVEKAWTEYPNYGLSPIPSDASMSGLVWDYFFALTPKPSIFHHVKAGNVWVFIINKGRDGYYEIRGIVDTTLFSTWDALTCADVSLTSSGIDPAYRAYYKKLGCDDAKLLVATYHIYDTITTVIAPQTEMLLDGHRVRLFSVPYAINTAVRADLAARYPKSFTGCWWEYPHGRVFELWSDYRSGLDVGAVARRYGGHGTRHHGTFTKPHTWSGDAVEVY